MIVSILVPMICKMGSWDGVCFSWGCLGIQEGLFFVFVLILIIFVNIVTRLFRL